jgi:hypothetical protein
MSDFKIFYKMLRGKILSFISISRNFATTIDWSRVLTKCSPSVRKGILDLRSKHEDLKRLIGEAQESSPKINFEHFKRELGTESGNIDEIEQKFNSFKPKAIDLKSQLSQLEAEKQEKVLN